MIDEWTDWRFFNEDQIQEARLMKEYTSTMPSGVLIVAANIWRHQGLTEAWDYLYGCAEELAHPMEAS